MATFKKSIVIQAPPEVLRRYLIDPTNLPHVFPNLSLISDVQNTAMNATHFTWEWQVLGVHFVGSAEMTEVIRNQELHMRFWGGLQGSMGIKLMPSAEGIMVETEFEYAIPAPLLHKHSEKEVIEQNESNLDGFLHNLKALIETRMHLQLH
ncbi:MAG: SRPBCC family protein [Anaerolineae bacterium]|nr:SRPBCC family protein [Anaerolineae bacterium]